MFRNFQRLVSTEDRVGDMFHDRLGLIAAVLCLLTGPETMSFQHCFAIFWQHVSWNVVDDGGDDNGDNGGYSSRSILQEIEQLLL